MLLNIVEAGTETLCLVHARLGDLFHNFVSFCHQLKLAYIRTGFTGASGGIQGNSVYLGRGQHISSGCAGADAEKVVVVFDFFPSITLNSFFVEEIVAGANLNFACDLSSLSVVIVVISFPGLPGVRVSRNRRLRSTGVLCGRNCSLGSAGGGFGLDGMSACQKHARQT